MEKISPYKQFSIKHRSRHRLEIIADGLKKDLERMNVLKILLLKRSAIEDVAINVTTGQIDIHFDTDCMPEGNLLQLLDNIIKNIAHKSSHSFGATVPLPLENESSADVIQFSVEGMSCSSCSLYLQLMLKREDGIDDANVDFASGSASVTTKLSQREIFDLVRKYGFQANSYDESAK